MRSRGRRVPDGKLRAAALRAAVATLKLILLAAAIGYVAIAALVWLGQERLLFYPRAPEPQPSPPPGWRVEHLSLPMRDGILLEGALVSPGAARGPLVIYFGGNAEEVTSYASFARDTYGPRAALFVNYRGYGRSGGKPSERDIVGDAIEIYDWAARRPDVDPQRIAVHGRSLGSGVAVQVAAARPARCAILTTPFDSALDIARAVYPWLPVSFLLRHPFDSAAHAPKLRTPALFLTGTADTLIPNAHSERLASLWGGRVERVSLEGFGHNDLQMHPRYTIALQAFLDRCL